MDENLLNRLLAFNRHLVALTKAGVPIDLGSSRRGYETELELLGSKVGLELGRDKTVEQALKDTTGLPAHYEAALKTLLLGNDTQGALDLMLEPGITVSQKKVRLIRSIGLPMIVFFLALVGLIVFCTFSVPTITAIYDDLEKSPPWFFQFLQGMRATLPVWATVAPLLILLWAGYALRAANKPREFKGFDADLMSKADAPVLASRLATLAKHKMPLGLESEQKRAALPALLKWSLNESADQEELSNRLRFTADFYQQRVVQTKQQWLQASPILISALVAGAIVLFYGLAVFASFQDLIFVMAEPPLETMK